MYSSFVDIFCTYGKKSYYLLPFIFLDNYKVLIRFRHKNLLTKFSGFVTQIYSSNFYEDWILVANDEFAFILRHFIVF